MLAANNHKFHHEIYIDIFFNIEKGKNKTKWAIK